MSTNLDRRTMLSQFALGGLALGAASVSPARAAARRAFFERIGKPIGLQLYTLGEIGHDLDATFDRLAAIGYRDIELPGLLGRTPVDLRTAADRAGITISSIHLATGKRVLPGSLLLTSPDQQLADILGTLGVSQAVMPMALMPEAMSAQNGESPQRMLARVIRESGTDVWKRTATLLNERGTALKRFGVALGYHNHNTEFAPIGSTSGWQILVHETDPSLIAFEVDIGWVASAGLDPARFLKHHAGRVRWLHIKDLKASTVPNYALEMTPTEVGAGMLDWPGILRAAHQAGVRHYYVEQEPPFSILRIEAVERSYRFLAALRA